MSSFGSRCFTQWCNFPRDKNFQICVLGNKFGLNLGLMWYIDLVLMVSLELSSINFTGWTCYNLLGNFLIEAIMGTTLKVSSKPILDHRRNESIRWKLSLLFVSEYLLNVSLFQMRLPRWRTAELSALLSLLFAGCLANDSTLFDCPKGRHRFSETPTQAIYQSPPRFCLSPSLLSDVFRLIHQTQLLPLLLRLYFGLLHKPSINQLFNAILISE